MKRPRGRVRWVLTAKGSRALKRARLVRVNWEAGRKA